RLASKLGQDLDCNEFAVATDWVGAPWLPSLESGKTYDGTGSFRNYGHDLWVAEQKFNFFARIGDTGGKAGGVDGHQSIQIPHDCRTNHG
ncbi:MAG TPA: hypothetical protein VND66_09060, partial [Acidobacteriaceae bacterium]|nr:hypothetical protein [Acidobacteriaceae bacterium]